MFLLEHYDWIFLEVGHVNFSTLFDQFWWFLDQQPSDVSKEKSFADGVGIELCVWKLVVKSMISAPMEDWSLIGTLIIKDSTWV